MNYLENCLHRKLLFFSGKGGVGKTTLAWSTALLCAKHNKKVTVCSWNPFGSQTPPFDFHHSNINWVPLQTESAFREYALRILKFEKIYDTVFSNHVLKTFVAAAPGLSETVIAGKIWDLVTHSKGGLTIVDLPSSGHTKSFFQSPLGVSDLFKVGFVHKEAQKIAELFQSRDTRIDLVTLPEELPITETKELFNDIKSLGHFPMGFIHYNYSLPKFPLPTLEKAVGLTPEITHLLSSYELESQRELEGKKELTSLGLPILEINRFGAKTSKEVIVDVSERLAQC